jgi:hypothetical protein
MTGTGWKTIGMEQLAMSASFSDSVGLCVDPSKRVIYGSFNSTAWLMT